MFLNRLRREFPRSIRKYYTVNSNAVNKQQDVIAKDIQMQIKATGPITVAEYMKKVLIHPMGGYYMHKDVFGAGGDFVTSPELGQVFGEMVAVWLLNEWSKVGSPKPFQIVELGPGRGSLCQDVLRVFDHFGALKSASVSLVEMSPFLSDTQARRLCLNSNAIHDQQQPFYREGVTLQGAPIKWYRNIQDVPKMFTLLVAHEFFDALPIHKFQKTDKGFREILIDINREKDLEFRYIIARDETPASKLFADASDTREHIEVSPESLVLVKDLASRFEEDGGMGLIADYGHDGTGTDTFRAFKKHQLHDPLVDAGNADLTADVDFSALRKAATEEGKVLAFGPITQNKFLLNMGIEHRVKKLEENLDEEQKKILWSSFHMMTDQDKMGSRFKFLSLLPAVLDELLKKAPVAGFN
ncbi:PREDICTED: NADH dehydrogenase [ubiquinone] complex I, assembly factor 7 homolog [Nicrophorus vespilloides]|uniref:Protein arginine methyltransferase NDUFAF7 n=1 Tax=Nicrophorus vespilloides TaxID=110193 RepID=A0ABM1N334_NICVS|nr:PREDICTED: NADH dehydrogenase [ubiquinone] complex I, assembly factor 7 homolog [Nicrophorus vespilloides]